MSIIIRLQNLPWTANAEDIRRFFDNITIPDGGVHIIGGEQGDTFIVFGSDEDARRAMLKDGGMIKNTQIKLLLSSRSEMMKVIETAKQQAASSQNLLNSLTVASQQFDPSTFQMPILPQMMSMMPALRNIPGMPTMPGMPMMPPMMGIPGIPGMPSLPGMPGIPGMPSSIPAAMMAQNMSANKTVPTTATSTVTSVVIKQEKVDSETKSGSNTTTSGEKSYSRSRSRSRSRERRNHRDKYSKRERSRDRSERKHHRDRSRSNRSRSRDRYRRRSHSKERRSRDLNRERDKDYSRDKDRRKDSDTKVEDSNSELNSSDKRENAAAPVDASVPNWWSNMIRPPMIPYMMPQTKNLVSEADKTTTTTTDPITGLPSVSFNMFPFGQAAFQAASNMFPYPGVFPPASNESLPVATPENNSVSQSPNERSDQEKPNYNTTMNGPKSGENRKYGYHRNTYEDDNSRDTHGSHDDSYSHKNPYRRNYNRVDYNHSENYRSGSNDYHSNGPYNQSNNGTSSSTCVEIRNVPRITNEQDIKKFFSPIPTFDSCIKFKNDKMGRNRIALVKFLNVKQKEQALLKDGYSIGGYRMHVLEIPLSTWEVAEKSPPTIDVVEEPYVKIRFIPKRATREDIAAVFSKEPETLIISNEKNRESLVAYVKCTTVEEVQTLLENKQKVLICDSRVGIEPIKRAAFETEQTSITEASSKKEEEAPSYSIEYPPKRPRPAVPPSRNQTKPADMEEGDSKAVPTIKSNCCIMKNLPPITDKEIVDFFAEINILPAQIHIMFNADYKQTGETYCEFRNETDAEAALKKNHTVLRDRTISMSLVPKEEVTKAIGISTLSPLIPYNNGEGQENKSKNIPAEEKTKVEEENKESVPATETEKNNQTNLPSLLNQEIDLPRKFKDYPPYGVGYGERYPMHLRRPMRKIHANFGSPGCVVTLENVPYRAEVEEIIDFFGHFNITEEHVMRRFNDWGQPTGDVRVCFRSPYEATKAVRMLNGCMIRGRIISLSVL